MKNSENSRKTKEVNVNTYKVIRKYSNKATAENAVRRTIAQHLK